MLLRNRPCCTPITTLSNHHALYLTPSQPTPSIHPHNTAHQSTSHPSPTLHPNSCPHHCQQALRTHGAHTSPTRCHTSPFARQPPSHYALSTTGHTRFQTTPWTPWQKTATASSVPLAVNSQARKHTTRTCDNASCSLSKKTFAHGHSASQCLPMKPNPHSKTASKT